MSGMNIMDFTICVSPPYFDTTYITDIEEWKKVERYKKALTDKYTVNGMLIELFIIY